MEIIATAATTVAFALIAEIVRFRIRGSKWWRGRKAWRKLRQAVAYPEDGIDQTPEEKRLVAEIAYRELLITLHKSKIVRLLLRIWFDLKWGSGKRR